MTTNNDRSRSISSYCSGKESSSSCCDKDDDDKSRNWLQLQIPSPSPIPLSSSSLLLCKNNTDKPNNFWTIDNDSVTSDLTYDDESSTTTSSSWYGNDDDYHNYCYEKNNNHKNNVNSNNNNNKVLSKMEYYDLKSRRKGKRIVLPQQQQQQKQQVVISINKVTIHGSDSDETRQLLETSIYENPYLTWIELKGLNISYSLADKKLAFTLDRFNCNRSCNITKLCLSDVTMLCSAYSSGSNNNTAIMPPILGCISKLEQLEELDIRMKDKQELSYPFLITLLEKTPPNLNSLILWNVCFNINQLQLIYEMFVSKQLFGGGQQTKLKKLELWQQQNDNSNSNNDDNKGEKIVELLSNGSIKIRFDTTKMNLLYGDESSSSSLAFYNTNVVGDVITKSSSAFFNRASSFFGGDIKLFQPHNGISENNESIITQEQEQERVRESYCYYLKLNECNNHQECLEQFELLLRNIYKSVVRKTNKPQKQKKKETIYCFDEPDWCPIL